MNFKLIYCYKDVTGKQSEPITVVLENDFIPFDDFKRVLFKYCDSDEFFAPDDLDLPTAYFDSVAHNPETYFHLHTLMDVQATEEEATHGDALTLLTRWVQHHTVGFIGREE